MLGGLNGRVVVRVRVDVVDDLPAVSGLDELDAGDLDAEVGQQRLEAADQRRCGRDLLTKGELGSRLDVGSSPGAGNRAGIGRAEFERSARDVDAHRIVETSADELRAGDERLSRLHILLDEGDAVDRRIRSTGRELSGDRLELGMGVETTYTEALAALIVLRDERGSEAGSGLDERLRSERGRSARRVETVTGQLAMLTDLAHLELVDPSTVDDPTARRSQPVKDGAAVLLHLRIGSGVRRCRQPRPEHSGRRLGGQVDQGLGQQPFDVCDAEAVERLGERGDPFRIVVDDVDRRITGGRQGMRTHREPSLWGADADCGSIGGSAQQSYALAWTPSPRQCGGVDSGHGYRKAARCRARRS